MKNPAEFVHGPVLIGLMFNLLLYGIMIVQVYIYFTMYKRDRTWMKIFVLVIFCLDTVNTIFNAIFIYDGVIKHFGDSIYLSKVNPFISMEPISTGVIEVMVQLFYAWRIQVLTRNWFLVALVIGLSLTGGAGCIVTEYKGSIIKDFSKFQTFANAVTVWLEGSFAADIIITGVLVWYLVSLRLLRRHKTGFKSSNVAVDRIIRVTMQTGLLTSLVAVVDLIVFLVDPTGTHFIFNVPLCKLYSNSLVSSLNSRGGWKFSDTPVEQQGRDVSTFAAAPGGGFEIYSEAGSSGWNTDVENPGLPRPTPKLFDRGTQPLEIHVESHGMLDSSR